MMSNEADLPTRPDPVELLTPSQMQEADRRAGEFGMTGERLMRRAAVAIANVVAVDGPAERPVAVLAGPGNNGGDAYAVARLLQGAGRTVDLYRLGDRDRLSGDAARMAAEWDGPSHSIDRFDPSADHLVVDGLFGAGLSKPVVGDAAAAIERLNRSGARVLAIDLPSGVDGSSGQVLGVALRADVTVTFERRKPGHLLMPGRSLCGRTIVAGIGIPSSVFEAIAPKTFANEPGLWADALLTPGHIHHKFDRGHAVVFSGRATHTGAARLSALAALRGGAGLVTLFSPASALMINATHLTAIMLKRCEDVDELRSALEDERLNSFVLGPGFGAGEKARSFAQAVLSAGRNLVLDADGITAFADDPEALFQAARLDAGHLVLTPHAGEFRRLFPDLGEKAASAKLEMAVAAARRSGAVVVLKGSDTVIAGPDGRAAINATGSPALATAGSGDVLAGLIAAQLANDVPAFEAACAAVWIHGKAAEAFGVGLISEDLPGLVPPVLAQLAASREATRRSIS